MTPRLAWTLTNEELVGQYPHLQRTLNAYRSIAKDWTCRAPSLAWRMTGGHTFQSISARFTNQNVCKDSKDWEKGFDEPTTESIVFWIPQLVPGSQEIHSKIPILRNQREYIEASDRKTSEYRPDVLAGFYAWRKIEANLHGQLTNRMMQHAAELKKRYGLPSHHATTLGPIAIHLLLLSANLKLTGALPIEKGECAISSTLRSDRFPLVSACTDSFSSVICYDHLHQADLNRAGYFLFGIEPI